MINQGKNKDEILSSFGITSSETEKESVFSHREPPSGGIPWLVVTGILATGGIGVIIGLKLS